eukprot:8670358-Pyramimonas_sp.AAC.1
MEETCLAKLKLLLTSRIEWVHLPRAWFTVNGRHRVFKLLSRALCCVQELLHVHHETYPYRLFLCLKDPTFTEVVLHEPDCLLDDFTLEWRERFKSEGLS